MIAIPSYNRANLLLNKALTLDAVYKAQVWSGEKLDVRLYVRDSEAEAYKPVAERYGCTLCTVGEDYYPVAKCRDYILRKAHEQGVTNVIMLDDDLRFAYRPTVKDPLVKCTPENVYELIDTLYNNTNATTPLTGPRVRLFANNAKEEISKNSRIICASCIHVPTVIERCWTYEWEALVMEDFHFQLRLLTEGYTTLTYNRWTADSGLASTGAGGCGTWRTAEVQTTAAKALAKAFPHCVKLRAKQAAYGPCYDVTIYFSRA